MTPITPGGDVGRGWVAGPIYPRQAQSQDPAYDERYNITINQNSAKFSIQDGIDGFVVTVPEGEFMYNGLDNSFSFYPSPFSGVRDVRDMTQKEFQAFLQIVRKNAQDIPAAKTYLANMEESAKKFSAPKLDCYSTYGVGQVLLRFEIPNKNIFFEFERMSGNGEIKIMRYKTTVPEFIPDKYDIMSSQKQEKCGKREKIPNKNKDKFSDWTEVPKDASDYKNCVKEIKTYIPKLITNLDPSDKNYKETKQLLLELNEKL